MSSCDQMSLVMFINQYLKRSANLVAENITASPFKLENVKENHAILGPL